MLKLKEEGKKNERNRSRKAAIRKPEDTYTFKVLMI
jgi:hypothetical protein